MSTKIKSVYRTVFQKVFQFVIIYFHILEVLLISIFISQNVWFPRFTNRERAKSLLTSVLDRWRHLGEYFSLSIWRTN